MSAKVASLLLLLCPVTLFALSIFTTNLQGPFYYGENSDPEYCYLLNGLNIATLQPPGHTDHPGTTLQVLDGGILLIKWAFSGASQAFQDAVLTHPEDYLHSIGLVLNLLLSAALYVAGWRIFRLSGSFPAALGFQLSFGLFMETFHAQTRVSPEPLLITAALLLFIPAAELIFNRNSNVSQAAIAIGLALAFGLVTKVTFFPLLGVCLLFRTRKSLSMCLVVCGGAVIALIFPIWTEIPRMLNWFGSIAIHKEQYGSGPVGIPTASTLLENLGKIAYAEPMLCCLPVLYAASYAALRLGFLRTAKGESGRIQRILLAGIVVVTIQVAITAKHFSLRYLLPALVFTMLVNAALIFLFTHAEPRARSHVFLAATALLFALGAWHSWTGMKLWRSTALHYLADTSSLLDRVNEMRDCAVISSYRSSSQSYALSFGDDFSRFAFHQRLAGLYPGGLHYNPWDHQFYGMRGDRKTDEIHHLLQGGACFLVQGTPLPPENLQQLRGFTLAPLLVVGHDGISEGLYRLGVDSR